MNDVVAAPAISKPLDQKYCSGCGLLIHKEAMACPSCGAPQGVLRGQSSYVPAPKSKVTAALLALFLGGIGIHKFYLGRAGWGVVYLLLFWTFIPAIVAFVEAIVYLTMSDEAFYDKYSKPRTL